MSSISGIERASYNPVQATKKDAEDVVKQGIEKEESKVAKNVLYEKKIEQEEQEGKESKAAKAGKEVPTAAKSLEREEPSEATVGFGSQTLYNLAKVRREEEEKAEEEEENLKAIQDETRSQDEIEEEKAEKIPTERNKEQAMQIYQNMMPEKQNQDMTKKLTTFFM